MINWYKLIKALKKFGNPPVSDIPRDYWPKDMISEAGLPGGGREQHDDWGIMLKDSDGKFIGKPVWWQPWQYIRRIKNAFMIPLPMKRIAGNSPYETIHITNSRYPVLPGTELGEAIRWDDKKQKNVKVRTCESMMSIAKPGKWFVSAAYLNGEWVPCYWARTIQLPFTKKVIKLYAGLKIDEDGPMAWFPEVSASFKLF